MRRKSTDAYRFILFLLFFAQLPLWLPPSEWNVYNDIRKNEMLKLLFSKIVSFSFFFLFRSLSIFILHPFALLTHWIEITRPLRVYKTTQRYPSFSFSMRVLLVPFFDDFHFARKKLPFWIVLQFILAVYFNFFFFHSGARIIIR